MLTEGDQGELYEWFTGKLPVAHWQASDAVLKVETDAKHYACVESEYSFELFHDKFDLLVAH